MLRALCLSLCLLLLALPSSARAQIENEEFGFTFTVPENYTEIEPEEAGQMLYTFLDLESTDEGFPSAIQIQRLQGLIDPNQRLSVDDVPVGEGITATLEEREWQGVTLDVMVMELETSDGGILTYIIQFPLAEEGVQLIVGGPAERREEIVATFDAVLEDFENTQPLYEGDGE